MDAVTDQVTHTATNVAGQRAGAAYRATLAAHSLAIGPRLIFGITAASLLAIVGHPGLALALAGLGLGIALLVGRTALRARVDLLAGQDEKNRLIATLTEARDEAMRQAGQAEAAREEARRASLAKSTFLATMSHE
ncbi:MAG: hypothetical protein Q7U11_13480, partial [Phenylobacterium sp.]|nr:hypothetical protein [Phenylobacterium sp.]